jgi:hypothetical protein
MFAKWPACEKPRPLGYGASGNPEFSVPTLWQDYITAGKLKMGEAAG